GGDETPLRAAGHARHRPRAKAGAGGHRRGPRARPREDGARHGCRQDGFRDRALPRARFSRDPAVLRQPDPGSALPGAEASMSFRTLWFEDGALHLLDQRALPARTEIVTARSAAEVAKAIREMVVRGAPA